MKGNSRGHRSFLLLLGFAGLAVIVSTLVLLSEPGKMNNTRTVSGTGGADYGFPEPESIADLAANAEVIIIGRVGSIVSSGTFIGYDASGQLYQVDTSSDTEMPLNWEFYDYRMVVEQVFKDDGAAAEDRVKLRMPGNRAAPVSPDEDYPMSAEGDHGMWFLSKNPDGTSYGLYYGAKSRLLIDGPVVTFSNGQRTPVNFGGRTFTLVEFIEALEAVLP